MIISLLCRRIDNLIDKLFISQDKLAEATIKGDEREVSELTIEVSVLKREFILLSDKLDNEIDSLPSLSSQYSQDTLNPHNTHSDSQLLTTHSQPLTSKRVI